MDMSKVTHAGDSTQINRAYLDSLLIEPKYLDNVVPDISTKLFGHQFSSPITICAFSHLGNQHPGGMVEMARGAKLAQICNFAGMGSQQELKDILSTGAGTIKIVKPYEERERVYDMLKFAEREGAIAVGMDIDHCFGHNGYPDVVLGEKMKPVTTEQMKSFVAATSLPFIVKGVLSVQDAVKCVEAGAKALIVSHHHGIVPYAVPPLMALPPIKDAIGDSAELIVDCSMDTGYDAFKALALGASAVCVGRAILPAFKEGGADGVKKNIDKMNDELRSMMAWTGSPDVKHISRDVLWDSSLCCKI